MVAVCTSVAQRSCCITCSVVGVVLAAMVALVTFLFCVLRMVTLPGICGRGIITVLRTGIRWCVGADSCQ